MRKIYLLLTFALFSLSVFAQKNGSVKGISVDTLAKQPIAGATVTVLEKKDSSLVTFTQTDNAGSFELRGIPNGEYRLLITHVNYHNYNHFFTINDEHKNADLGSISMDDITKVLGEVVVTNEAPPVTLINDTIQYNAGSFKTQPNANVEQLLKKLPGIKVERDGSIKAQGEKVNRVLVDGKEFFGDDPKVATKNLPADAIDKVQVYDKQSDQVQLTGFDDGNYEKTINLKLKKDKKKGLFGKVSAGGGSDDRYEGKFNLNSFKGARQLSAIGMGNNTNAEGFSFMDILNFTGELSRMQRGNSGGNININISDEDASAMGVGGNTNNGINTAWGGGVNYNNIIGNKLDWQSNYFYNRLNPHKESHIQRQYFLPDSSYFYNQNAFTDNLTNSHRLNLNTLYQIDSMNSIRFIPSFSYQRVKNRSHTDYSTFSEDHILGNDGFSNNTLNNEGYNFRNDIIYRKKFARRGRTFSLTLQTSLNQSNGDGSLFSINNFYHPDGTVILRDTLNQQNKTEGDLKSYNARAVYTEPLWKKSLLEFSMGHSNSRNTARKTTYDLNSFNNKYDQVNQFLSNNFENDYSYTNAGIRMRTQKKKYNYSFGAAWQHSALEGKIVVPASSGVKDSMITKSFHDILPTLRIQYNFSKMRSLSINYSTSTNQPSISQLQPVPDNSNPLSIMIGNPDLKQEYIHSVMGNLNLINPYKNKNLFVYFYLQATRNKIVNADSVNALGVKTTRPVNVNGVYNFNSNTSYSFPLHFLNANLEIRGDAGYFKGKQFINGIDNNIRTLSLGPGLRLDINPNDKINFSMGAGINYNHTTYSLGGDLNTNYLSQEYNGSIDWEMPKRFYFSSDLTYTINSERAAGFNTKVPIWNANISRQILRFNRGELKFSAMDLLDRNIGISRTTNQNYIEDSRVKTLRRFFLLSFTYSLSKTGLNNTGSGDGMRIIAR